MARINERETECFYCRAPVRECAHGVLTTHHCDLCVVDEGDDPYSLEKRNPLVHIVADQPMRAVAYIPRRYFVWFERDGKYEVNWPLLRSEGHHELVRTTWMGAEGRTEVAVWDGPHAFVETWPLNPMHGISTGKVDVREPHPWSYDKGRRDYRKAVRLALLEAGLSPAKADDILSRADQSAPEKTA